MPSWYDQYKEEKILIHQGDEHNKFWAAWWDEKTNKVHVRWGRIGTKGQSKVHDKGDRWSSARFIETKFGEKRRKGYTDQYNGKPITQATLDQLHTEAAIVGTQNKCHNFQWVEIEIEAGKAVYFKNISEDRLYDPECNPAIVVDFETRKDIGGRDRFRFLFTLEETYDILGNSQRATNDQLVGQAHPLRKMVDKVEEAIGRSLGGG
jgi:predicted DNA-binding WGR domain protein